MTYQLINLPTKGSTDDDIVCAATESYFTVYAKGWRICDVTRATPEGTASDIADVVRLARDAGFAQGVRSVRLALGIKEQL